MPVADEFKDHYTNAIIYVNRLETTKSETGTNGDNATDVHSEPSPGTSSKVLNGHGEEAAWQPATVNVSKQQIMSMTLILAAETCVSIVMLHGTVYLPEVLILTFGFHLIG